MNRKSPEIIINKLVLVGREKNYTVNFHVGLNIIYGDSDTGKSSILNLIDYLLGNKKVYMYDEIEQHGKYAMLEVTLNDRTYTIKREIFYPKDNIEVYSSDIENMDKIFPLEYSPNYEKEGPAGHFSDFLLSSLNIPIIQVKQSPSRVDSKMVRLSFRDIFKYCYFNQDDVGSREILDRKNYTLVAKNKETFKFLHNSLDIQITEIEKQIGERNKKKTELVNKYNIISSFLLETKLSTEESLHEERNKSQSQITVLENEIDVLSKEMKADNQELEELRGVVINLETSLKQLLFRKSLKESQLDQNLRLKKDYQNDIDKLQTSLQMKNRKELQPSCKVECPLCNNFIDTINVNDHFVQYDEDIIKKEINSIRNRIKDLYNLIEQLRDDLYLLENKLEKDRIQLDKARESLDISSEKFISPYISQRDMLVSVLYTSKEKLKKIEYLLKMRKHLNELKEDENILVDQIEELDAKLKKLKENAPSISDTLHDIGTYLREFLEFIPIKNAFGISISNKTYLPIVRNRDYQDLTSGGLRTLVSIGYITSLMKNSLYNDTNLPSLIMIDTVGKYLGKTKNNIQNEEIDGTRNEEEGLNDPKKYLKIYKYLAEMSEGSIQQGKKHQIIIVDNDFPEQLEKDCKQYVVKRFSVQKKEGYEIGFINNAN